MWNTASIRKLLLPLSEDLGTCWRDLGAVLNLSDAELCNIRTDYDCNKERAYAVISRWIRKKEAGATMEHLAVALGEIGRNDIAHMLTGMLLLFLFKEAQNSSLCFREF